MAKREIPEIQAQARERVGSRYAARLREQGQLPAVIYGHGESPAPITLDYRSFSDLVHNHAHLVKVNVGGKGESCLVREVQWNTLGTKIVHADLTRVDMSEEVEVELEVELTGEPEALEEAGASLSHQTTSITVACRADAIPEMLQQDISHLGVNESLTVADLPLPPGVRAVTDPETVLATISILQEVPEEAEAEEAAEGEPEVIGKGGEEEEGESAS